MKEVGGINIRMQEVGGRRGSMCFTATGDAICLQCDMVVQGTQNCVEVIDDLLLYDEYYVTHLHRIHEVVTSCHKFGIKSPRYTPSGDGISADHQKVSAFKDFPTAANLMGLRLFMGLVNQVAEFTCDIIAPQPLRPLMSLKRTFVWTSDYDESFQRVKLAFTRPPVLALFYPDLPVVLHIDASRLNGTGYALQQDHEKWHLRPVQCGYHFLANADMLHYH
ncbi:uncharacterized protein [Palaemon carinicauda]|uniref:uncharacterized protein n=1 Tax=Palaemon carinicauda TaxID=392227 RepID=UPI0035B68547